MRERGSYRKGKVRKENGRNGGRRDRRMGEGARGNRATPPHTISPTIL